MKEFIIYTDVHKLAPHEISVQIHPYHNAIYMGDNVDMNNCKYDDVNQGIEMLEEYQREFKDRFLAGNHELDLVDGYGHYIDRETETVFVHGDRLFWGNEKRAKYIETKTPGAGFFTRSFFIPLMDYGRRLMPDRYSKDFKQRAHELCVMVGCKRVVCGHKHPKETAVIDYNGIEIVVLTRGQHSLWLQ